LIRLLQSFHWKSNLPSSQKEELNQLKLPSESVIVTFRNRQWCDDLLWMWVEENLLNCNDVFLGTKSGNEIERAIKLIDYLILTPSSWMKSWTMYHWCVLNREQEGIK
jgi:hypothetical protein